MSNPKNTMAKEATTYTKEINQSVYNKLNFDDEKEVEFSKRGLIDAPEHLELVDGNGKVVWSQKAYEFVDGCCPDTANPSLWRHTYMNHQYGLFKVNDKIYQVRGYDMANLTVVKGDTGWIVFDPLLTIECSRAAMDLVDKNLGKFPIKAIIISHSHIDHYGGIKGIVSQEELADPNLSIEDQVASGKIPLIVSEGFVEYAVSENVNALNAMSRRAGYMYGAFLDKGPKDSLAIGIGMGQSLGVLSFLNPTFEITHTGETVWVDGVEMVFQMTPGSEAPTEMNTYFPQMKALWMAENCTGTLHNLYTIRGAQVRDGNIWAKYILESMSLYGKDLEVIFQSHNWPHWGNEEANQYMLNTAAMYKFINDQTLMYINQGYTPNEIARLIHLPDKLSKVWYTRQYYGTLIHNSKAVYQKYMGWYDANPIHLNELAPSMKAKKFVEYFGDTDKVLELAKQDYDKGEYQWVAEVTNMLVFADANNVKARQLCADAMEQLGYQAESGIWRNAYLAGAYELRYGKITDNSKRATETPDALMAMSLVMIFEYMGILVDANKAEDEDMVINFNIIDQEKKCAIHLFNGVLLYFEDTHLDGAVSEVSCYKNQLLHIVFQNYEKIKSDLQVKGDLEVLVKLATYMQPFDFFFNIIED